MATPPVANGKQKAHMTRKQFLDAAPNYIEVKLGDLVVQARCRLFKRNEDGEASVGFGYYETSVFPCQRGKVISGSVNGQPIGIGTFSKGGSGKWNYHLGGKVKLDSVKDKDGNPVELQVGINITANKSESVVATTFDNEVPWKCRFNVNIMAIGSKEGWEDGGNIKAWEKPEKEEGDEAPAKKPVKAGKK